MNRLMKLAVQLILVSTLLILSAAPGFAAEVRRVPSKASVEQGFAALTIGVEGSDDFQYIGLEDKNHMYRGTIKPGSKLQFTIVATLAEQKSLPITGRSCLMRLKVVAKKGDEVIKTQNYSKENKSNVFVNYTVPEGADTLEVSETFVLSNKSKDEKFNQRVTSLNKLILTTSGAGSAAAVTNKAGDSGDKKTDTGSGKNADKKDNAKDAGSDKNMTGSNKKDSGDNGKADVKESKGPGMGMLVGAVVAVAAIGGGAFFYMKKRKEGQAAAEEIARKEKLRQQAILRQQELQEQNRQREAEQQRAMQQQHEAEQQRLMQEERMREQEQARQQQMQREAEQQRLMQEQNATQQPGATGAYVAGAAGVMGGVQQNAAENAPNAAPKFCTNCGTPLKPGSKFCVNCGAKL